MPIPSRTPFLHQGATFATTRPSFLLTHPLLYEGPSRTSSSPFAFPQLNPFLRATKPLHPRLA
jgi:hypothetical protein